MLDFTYEQSLLDAGYRDIAGIDEVGRGSWAGPVTACAVILDPTNIPQGLNDSKKLNKNQRLILYDQIMLTARVSVINISAAEIDTINILQATFRAMESAVLALGHVEHALIDGKQLPPKISCPATAIIKGDNKSLSIAAASIIAKVTRDRIMLDLSKKYPGYSWETNAGYGTKAHQNALRNIGVSPYHRRSYKPIYNILYPSKKK